MMDKSELEHGELIERLERLGSHPVPPAVAVSHLATLRSVARARRPWGRTALAAAASAVVFGGGAVVWAAAGLGGTGGSLTSQQPATIEPVQEDPGDVATPGPVDPTPDDPCTGPPPFAGGEREGDTKDEQRANHRAAVDEHVATRTACGGDDAEDTGSTEGSARPDVAGPAEPDTDPAQPDDACTGPPPWAGATPAGASPQERAAIRAAIKAAERAAWVASRVSCRDDEDGSGAITPDPGPARHHPRQRPTTHRPRPARRPRHRERERSGTGRPGPTRDHPRHRPATGRPRPARRPRHRRRSATGRSRPARRDTRQRPATRRQRQPERRRRRLTSTSW
jgi:hypothetical protein